MEIPIWFYTQARIIAENWDDKIASGFNDPEFGDDDDYMSAISDQVSELHAELKIPIRRRIIKFFNEKYKISLKIDDSVFKYNNKEINLIREIPGGRPPTGWTGNLKEMPSDIFRETLAECLAIIPGGIQKLRNMAEKTPYIFD